MEHFVNKDKLQEFATKLHNKQKTIFASKTDVGSPLIANTVAEMTDTDRVYVYTGSETGYTSGNWYYYDGSAWVSGGIYNSQAIADNSITFAKLADDVLENFDIVNSRNILPIGSKSATVNDVSSEYSDGILTISGKATANGGRLTPVTDYFTLPAGTYIFSRNVAVAAIMLETGSTILAQLMGTTLTATFTLESSTQCYVGINLTNGDEYSQTYDIQLEKGSVKTDWQKPSYTFTSAVDKDARSDIETIGLPYEKAELSWTTGKAFVYNAGWTNNTGWSYADVELIQGQGLLITLYAMTVVYPLSVWSDDGNSIIRVCFDRPTEDGTTTYFYMCESQHEKVRINTLSSAIANVNAQIYKPNNEVNLSNIKSNNNNLNYCDVLHSNIIAIGDSLTQGSYTGHDLHPQQSYPAFLAKLTGADVENAGRAGWSTIDWWTGASAEQKGFPYYNYAEYDTAVICLGTNGGLTDTLNTDVDPYSDYTDYADTNTGCYCKIIEGIKAQNPDINIVLCTIWAGGGTTGIYGTNDVINKIAQKYSLFVVDLTLEFLTVWSVYHAVANNIHLGRIGYAKMAEMIRQGINNNVQFNPTKYNYIPS